jgi:hypothetical protein
MKYLYGTVISLGLMAVAAPASAYCCWHTKKICIEICGKVCCGDEIVLRPGGLSQIPSLDLEAELKRAREEGALESLIRALADEIESRRPEGGNANTDPTGSGG